MDMGQQHVSRLLKNDVIYNVMPSNEFGMTKQHSEDLLFPWTKHAPINTYIHTDTQIILCYF